MARKLENDPRYRTTDHSYERTRLRELYALLEHRPEAIDDCEVAMDQTGLCLTILDAAQALLECHDDTGLSLDNWGPVRVLVEKAIDMANEVLKTQGTPWELTFLKNGI